MASLFDVSNLFFFVPEYTKMKRESGLTALDNEISCAAEKSIISFEWGKTSIFIGMTSSWILFYLRHSKTELNWIKVKWLKQAKCTKDDMFKWLYKCIHCRRVYGMSINSLYTHRWYTPNDIRMDWIGFVLVLFTKNEQRIGEMLMPANNNLLLK